MGRIVFSNTKKLLMVLFLIFSLIQGLCLIMSIDDIWWYNIDSLSDMLSKYCPNGRYFTNILTYLICHNSILRLIVYICSIMLFFISFSTLLKSSKKGNDWFAYFISAALIFLAPRFFYVHVFTWISGFTNYIISLVFTFSFLSYCLPVFDHKKPKDSFLISVFYLIVGFLGAMCVENITFYNIALAIFVITYSLIVNKKVSFSFVTFLLGTIVGTFLLFSDRNYTEIYSGQDNVGIRSFDLTLEDCIVKVYNDIIFYFARMFCFVHIIISISVLALVIIKFKNNKCPKYVPICIPVIIGYSIYSILTVTAEQFFVMSYQFKIRAFETAFAFIYIISLAYMIYVTLENSARIRALIYLISTIIVSAPFIFVNPVSSRCFFADYFFWALLAGELLLCFVSHIEFTDYSVVKISALSFVFAFTFIYSFETITNKCVDNLRIEYVKEQLANNESKINLIKLPYEHNSFDPFNILEDDDYGTLEKNGRVYSFSELLCITYGIDESIFDKQWTFITMLDYNTLNEE